MARTLRTSTRLPYVVMGEFRPDAVTRDRWAVCRRSTLDRALDEARRATTAWRRLIGANRSPLVWFVQDERDFTEHWLDPSLAPGKADNEGRSAPWPRPVPTYRRPQWTTASRTPL